jgi:hypothetical protein
MADDQLDAELPAEIADECLIGIRFFAAQPMVEMGGQQLAGRSGALVARDEYAEQSNTIRPARDGNDHRSMAPPIERPGGFKALEEVGRHWESQMGSSVSPRRCPIRSNNRSTSRRQPGKWWNAIS